MFVISMNRGKYAFFFIFVHFFIISLFLLVMYFVIFSLVYFSQIQNFFLKQKQTRSFTVRTVMEKLQLRSLFLGIIKFFRITDIFNERGLCLLIRWFRNLSNHSPITINNKFVYTLCINISKRRIQDSYIVEHNRHVADIYYIIPRNINALTWPEVIYPWKGNIRR